MTFIETINRLKSEATDTSKLCFKAYRFTIYLSDNKHLLEGDYSHIIASCYNIRKGGIKQERLDVEKSATKGLFITKFGKRQYLDEFQLIQLKSYFPNRS